MLSAGYMKSLRLVMSAALLSALASEAASYSKEMTNFKTHKHCSQALLRVAHLVLLAHALCTAHTNVVSMWLCYIFVMP